MKNPLSQILIAAIAAAVLAFSTSASAQYTETTLYNFTFGNDGGSPVGLVADSSGNFYGIAAGGPVTTACPFTCGVVFRLSKSGGIWRETVLYSFTNGNDGEYPSGITVDSSGDVFGVTSGDVTQSQDGTAFELRHTTTGWRFNLLYRFGTVAADGIDPRGAPVLDATGNFYAVTYSGGSSTACTQGCGTIIELSPTSSGPWTETILHSFSGTPDGELPQAGMTFDTVGNLFGTTGGGGTDNVGTVFELTPSSSGWTENVIYNFRGQPVDGLGSKGQLILDASGNFYGTTYGGGSVHNNSCFGYCGTVFELSPASGGGWTEKVLHSFNYTTDGALPDAGVTMDASGHLYGTTLTGGAGGRGTVFQLTKGSSGTWTETVLCAFNTTSCPNGGVQESGVLLDSTGDLYGASTDGGTYNGGIIYKLFPRPPQVPGEAKQ